MTQQEILEQIKKLPTMERLAVVEAALHLIHEDLQYIEMPSSQVSKSQRLAHAAKALLKDYSTDNELKAFTALDSEDFHAER